MDSPSDDADANTTSVERAVNHRDEENENLSDTDSDGDEGVSITTVRGKLTVTQQSHILYLHRCSPEDTDHPLHGMCYLVWHRLIRVERCSPSDSATSTQTPSGSDEDDQPAPTTRQRGKPLSDRYDCVGEYNKKWTQVIFVYHNVQLNAPMNYI